MRGGKLIISFIVIVAFLAVIIWAVFSYGGINLLKNSEDNAKVNLSELRKNYQTELIAIMPEYEELVQVAAGKEADIEVIHSLRNKMLALKMPAEFKELHLSLIMLLDKMEDSIDSSIKPNYQENFQSIISGYEWL